MSSVAVTGGSGKLGRAVVRELVDHGWDVVNLDVSASTDPVAPFTRVQLRDYGQVLDALTFVDERVDGLDALVHLAAVPGPGMWPNQALFENNLLATSNVFLAARRAGITNIVWASSETLLGLPFDEPPDYVPVDEASPLRPQSSYSLAKYLEEQMAGQLCRWDPALKMIALRFSNVMEEGDYAGFPAFDSDPRLRKWNLWSYIDARDAAQAVRRALAYEPAGFDAFIIANADTVMSRPVQELLREVFPAVDVRKSLEPHETLLSIDKARRLLGYSPEYSWRSHVDRQARGFE